jgi:undecaprenyl diphosphate synthase
VFLWKCGDTHAPAPDPDLTIAALERLIAVSSVNTDGLTLCLALSYGGREELAAAAAAAAGAVAAGALSASSLADPATFGRFLPHASILPDPDLLIRTSGELRVSNFLLWQVRAVPGLALLCRPIRFL